MNDVLLKFVITLKQVYLGVFLLMGLFIGVASIPYASAVTTRQTHTTKPHYLGSITFGGEESTWLYSAPSVTGYVFAPLPFQHWTDKLIFSDFKANLYSEKVFLVGAGLGYRQIFKGFFTSDRNIMNQMVGIHFGGYFMNSEQQHKFMYGSLDLEYIYSKVFFKFSSFLPFGNDSYWDLSRKFKDTPQPPEEDGDLLSFFILRQNTINYKIDRIYTGGELKGGMEVIPGLDLGAGGYYLTNAGKQFPTGNADLVNYLKPKTTLIGGLLSVEYDILDNPKTSIIVGRYVPFSDLTANFAIAYDAENKATLIVGLNMTLRTFPLPNDKGIYGRMVQPVWTSNPYGYKEDSALAIGTEKLYKLNSHGDVAHYRKAGSAGDFWGAIGQGGDGGNISGVILQGQIGINKRVNLPNDFVVCGNTCELDIYGKDYIFSTHSKKGTFKPSWIQFDVKGNQGIGKKVDTGIHLGKNNTIYDVAIFMSGTKPSGTNSTSDLSTLGDAQPAIFNDDTKDIGTLMIKKVTINGGYIDLTGMTSDSTIEMDTVNVLPGALTHLTHIGAVGTDRYNADLRLDMNIYDPSLLVDTKIFPQNVTLDNTLVKTGIQADVEKPQNMIKGGITIIQEKGTVHIKDFTNVSVGRDMESVDTSMGQSGYFYNDMGGIMLSGTIDLQADGSIDHIYLSRSSLPDDLMQAGGGVYLAARNTNNGSLYYSCAFCLIGTGNSWNHKFVVSGDVEAIGQNSFGLYFKGKNNTNTSDDVQLILAVKGQVKTTEYGGMGIFQDTGETSGILIEGGVITDGPNASGVFVQAGGTLKNIDIEGGILTETYSSPGLDIYGTIDSMVIRSGIRAYLSDGIRVNANGILQNTVVHDLIFSIGTVYTGETVAGGGDYPACPAGNHICHSNATVKVWYPSNGELRNLRYSNHLEQANVASADLPANTGSSKYLIQGWYSSADGIHLEHNSEVKGLVVFGIPGYPFAILSTGFPIAIGANVKISSSNVVVDDDGTVVKAGISILSASYTSDKYKFSQMLGGRLPFGYINYTYVDQPFSTASSNQVNAGPLFGNANTMVVEDTPSASCIGYVDNDGKSHSPSC